METNYFMQEVKRLQNRFGAGHFDSELLKLIWSEVRDLPNKDFKTIVDTCIGEFKIDYPPRLSHFREFAHERRKANERAQNRQFAKNWNISGTPREESTDGFMKAVEDKEVLKTLHPEFKSLLDSIVKKRSNHHGET